MRWNIICGGPAGQGPNFLANLITQGLIEKGFFVFTAREYESRIRGGHNYNTITFSDEELYSNSDEVDLLVALDELSEINHKKEMKKSSFVVKSGKSNAYDAGASFKVLGIEIEILDTLLKKMANYEENFAEAKKGYEEEKRVMKLPAMKKAKDIYLMNGNEGVEKGAEESGLDFYYAYPMTPATGVLFELVKNENKDKKYITVQLEGEVAVINAAIGGAATGAKTMIGTSGGGFDLMTEGLSLAGGAGIPLVIYMAQRVGPATGSATHVSQGDLNIARHSGHGEFPRIVVSPGDPKESIEKTSELFYLTQKYQLPGIVLSDKHVADSFYTLNEKAKITKSKNSVKWPARFSSYETDSNKITDASSENIIKSVNSRIEKFEKLSGEVEGLESYKVYGKANSKNIVIGWGGTKGAIIDSIRGLDCKFIQVLYLEPFSSKIKKEIEKGKNIILVECNASAQLGSLIAEKTGILIENKNKILKYDGRPFLFENLRNEIKRRLK